MVHSLAFAGRTREIEQLRAWHVARRHVLVIGAPGIGKTALLRRMRQEFPLLLCEETSSLRRICDCLERELGWTHRKLNVIERKNRLLAHLGVRGEVVVFDHVALTVPRIARFMAAVAERVPVWIGCRSALAHDIGRVWEYLARFERIELTSLSPAETRELIVASADAGHIQPDAREHCAELHRMSQGNPRLLEQLLVELAARKYHMNDTVGLDLLALDRRIHEFALAMNAVASAEA